MDDDTRDNISKATSLGLAGYTASLLLRMLPLQFLWLCVVVGTCISVAYSHCTGGRDIMLDFGLVPSRPETELERSERVAEARYLDTWGISPYNWIWSGSKKKHLDDLASKYPIRDETGLTPQDIEMCRSVKSSADDGFSSCKKLWQYWRMEEKSYSNPLIRHLGRVLLKSEYSNEAIAALASVENSIIASVNAGLTEKILHDASDFLEIIKAHPSFKLSYCALPQAVSGLKQAAKYGHDPHETILSLLVDDFQYAIVDETLKIQQKQRETERNKAKRIVLIRNPLIIQLEQASDDMDSKAFLAAFLSCTDSITASANAGLADRVIRDTTDLVAVLKASTLTINGQEQAIRNFEQSIAGLKRAKRLAAEN